MQSINEDTNDSRVRRGELPFSIQARNGTGHSIIGFANDRILKQFKKTKKTPSWKWSVVSKDGTIHLPTLLAIVVAALGILVIFAICIKYKITRKIGWECCSERQRIEDSDSTSSTATTSEHVYSNDDWAAYRNMYINCIRMWWKMLSVKLSKIALGMREFQSRDDRKLWLYGL